MSSTSASAAGTLSLAEPIAAVALSVALLAETLSSAQTLGFTLVIAGLLLTVIKPERQESGAPRSTRDTKALGMRAP